jgi:hypothetical protein
MPQKPETRFRMRFRARLDKLPNSWFESIQQKAICGTPDIIGCVNGYFVGLELKAKASNKPTRLQELKLELIRTAKGYSVTVHPGNMEEVLEHLEKLANL